MDELAVRRRCKAIIENVQLVSEFIDDMEIAEDLDDLQQVVHNMTMLYLANVYANDGAETCKAKMLTLNAMVLRDGVAVAGRLAEEMFE